MGCRVAGVAGIAVGLLLVAGSSVRDLAGAQGTPPAQVRPLVVRNDSAPIWDDETRWEVVERFRIGTIDGGGPTAFGGGQLSVQTTSRREILVLDHQAHDIRVFDSNGQFLRTIGREGEGPGEFQSPMGILIDATGRAWVPEAFNGRYTVFDRDGELVKTVPRALRTYHRLRELSFEDPSRFIDHASTDGGAGFYRVDTLGAVLDTFPRLPYPSLPRGLSGPLTGRSDSPVRSAVRFGLQRLVWTLAPDHTIWFGYSDELRLIQRTLEGDTLRIIETAHRPPSFTPAEAEVVRDAEREMGARSVFSPQVWRGVHVLDDGHILVHVSGEFGEVGTEFDVFDPRGRFLGTLPLPFRMPQLSVPSFDGDEVVAVHVDEFGVQYIVSAVIQR